MVFLRELLDCIKNVNIMRDRKSQILKRHKATTCLLKGIAMLKVCGRLLEISTFLCNKGREGPISFIHSTECPSGSFHSSGEAKPSLIYGLSIVAIHARREGPGET